jgi:hypothetical protein
MWDMRLLKCRYAYEDAATLKGFSEKLSFLAGDMAVESQLSTTTELQAIKDSRALVLRTY